MEKGKSEAKITSSLEKLQLNSVQNTLPSLHKLPLEKAKRRSLVSLCLGVLGQHFEDIIEDLSEIAAQFPPYIKMALLAVARRRDLLNDDVLIALAENSWDVLDISWSKVTDFGLVKVRESCNMLRAVDVSCCREITAVGVSDLLSHCHSLEVLRWGGCNKSDSIARRCLSILKPKLNDVEGESWEELDSTDIANGVQSLRWLVWPTIDEHSMDTLATECPRILVNPKPSPFGFRGVNIPREAFSDVALDDLVVKDIDPKTWAVRSVAPRITITSESDASELSVAERFRLAFVERDTRLAPKRAKNARQHRRRADREWMMTSADAKSIALASQANKFLHNRS